jgi:hypothetical protein
MEEKQCVVCKRRLGHLDIYVEHEQGVLCPTCLGEFGLCPVPGAERQPAGEQPPRQRMINLPLPL